ncbi:hypothetical protein ACQEXU_13255 [Vibrio sp. TRT 21S02]|uniref:hypothetical protein n=1 Tax=Vibrio sp. TRT 21S02 TaxID=3418507 RepID=UPI003CF03198
MFNTPAFYSGYYTLTVESCNIQRFQRINPITAAIRGHFRMIDDHANAVNVEVQHG